MGYDDLPRGATIEEPAAELNCATPTAAEHLRTAERNVLSSLLGE